MKKHIIFLLSFLVVYLGPIFYFSNKPGFPSILPNTSIPQQADANAQNNNSLITQGGGERGELDLLPPDQEILLLSEETPLPPFPPITEAPATAAAAQTVINKEEAPAHTSAEHQQNTPINISTETPPAPPQSQADASALISPSANQADFSVISNASPSSQPDTLLEANPMPSQSIAAAQQENLNPAQISNAPAPQASIQQTNSNPSPENTAQNIAQNTPQNTAQNTASIPEVSIEEADFVNVKKLPVKLFFDIKYATADNFTGKQIYNSEACYLKRQAAMALLRAAEKAQASDSPFYFCVYDCYRPPHAQFVLWETLPKSGLVANPYLSGSNHSKGMAVDIGPCDETGSPLPAPTKFDEFTPQAYSDATEGISQAALKNRNDLQKIMRSVGFITIRKEWWHFDYQGYKKYPVVKLKGWQ